MDRVLLSAGMAAVIGALMLAWVRLMKRRMRRFVLRFEQIKEKFEESA
jgi:hypothetical protein